MGVVLFFLLLHKERQPGNQAGRSNAKTNATQLEFQASVITQGIRYSYSYGIRMRCGKYDELMMNSGLTPADILSMCGLNEA